MQLWLVILYRKADFPFLLNNSMNFKLLKRSTFNQLVEFLKTDEWQHVLLTSRLKESGNVLPRTITDGRIWLLSDTGGIHGCLYMARYGLVIPVFKLQDFHSQVETFLQRLIMSRQNRIYSVTGMSDQVNLIVNLSSSRPVHNVYYRMFTYDSQRSRNVVRNPSIKIEMADPSDFEKLWPLEKAYQNEEVVRAGYSLNENHARMLFSHSLKNQLIYYITLEGHIIAKAGTNARGWNYDQIGGVYVDPAYRNRGMGQQVMQELLNTAERDKRRVCLFVKETNKPALSLYSSLGFNDRGSFRISYWR